MADILHIRDFQPIRTREDMIDNLAKEFELMTGETIQVQRLGNVVTLGQPQYIAPPCDCA
jgi:hypothetical protein